MIVEYHGYALKTLIIILSFVFNWRNFSWSVLHLPQKNGIVLFGNSNFQSFVSSTYLGGSHRAWTADAASDVGEAPERCFPKVFSPEKRFSHFPQCLERFLHLFVFSLLQFSRSKVAPERKWVRPNFRTQDGYVSKSSQGHPPNKLHIPWIVWIRFFWRISIHRGGRIVWVWRLRWSRGICRGRRAPRRARRRCPQWVGPLAPKKTGWRWHFRGDHSHFHFFMFFFVAQTTWIPQVCFQNPKSPDPFGLQAMLKPPSLARPQRCCSYAPPTAREASSNEA